MLRRGLSHLDFTWSERGEAPFYRIELENLQGRPVLSALLLPGANRYRAPAWLKERVPDGKLRWRVVALDEMGVTKIETPWRTLRLSQ